MKDLSLLMPLSVQCALDILIPFSRHCHSFLLVDWDEGEHWKCSQEFSPPQWN